MVHSGVSKSHLQSISNLSADVIGVPIEYDFSGTIEQALRWHPAARRLVIVTGAAERDRGWEARLRREVPPVAGSVPVEFLAGLSTACGAEAPAANLAPTPIVFTPGYYHGRRWSDIQSARGRDADGRRRRARRSTGRSTPSSASASSGGRMPSFEAMGRQAGTDRQRTVRRCCTRHRCACRRSRRRRCRSTGGRSGGGASTSSRFRPTRSSSSGSRRSGRRTETSRSSPPPSSSFRPR